MEGDKVYLNVVSEEKNGIPFFEAEIGEKPRFMLDEEYVGLIIGCAVESVRAAANEVYPDDEEMRGKIAKAIAIKATEE